MGSLYQRGNVWCLMSRQRFQLIREFTGSKKERLALRMLTIKAAAEKLD